jgi:DNA-binding response OmpR family regulator
MAEEHLLVIEDDRDIARLMEMHLSDEGYQVEVVHDGRDGLELATTGRFDLIVLDLMLPGMDGLEICRHLRASQPYVLVLMLTAKTSELDRVLGLEIGADDYLTKPFSLRELQARIKALLRRRAALSTDVGEVVRLETGDLLIDASAREVRLAGETVHLTAKEFDLLVQFARNPGRVYTRAQLLDLVWGYGYEGFEHTVNSHINRLRAKIERDPTDPAFIQTVWGVGYKFVDSGR